MGRFTRLLQTDKQTGRGKKGGNAQHLAEGQGVRKKDGERVINMVRLLLIERLFFDDTPS